MKKKIALVMSLIMLLTVFVGNIAPSTAKATNIADKITLGNTEYKNLDLPEEVVNSEYVAVETTLKALREQAFNWDNVMSLGIVNGNGDFYEFQLIYGNPRWEPAQNVVKLGGKAVGVSYLQDAIPQEQNIAKEEMKAAFTEKGLPLKMVRMEKMVYLQAKLAGVWTLIGRMALPDGVTSGIAFNNWKTTCEFSNIKVTSGKEAVLNIFNGASMEFGSSDTMHFFPTLEKNWQVEGKLIDTNKSSTAEKRLMTIGNISVLYNHDWGQNWFTQLMDGTWPTVEMKQELKAAFAADGVYFKYLRNGDRFRTFFSPDGKTWIEGLDRTGMGDGVDAIKLQSFGKNRVENFKITVGDHLDSDLTLNRQGDFQWVTGKGPGEADYNYAAATFTLKSPVTVASTDTWRSFELGIGGGNPFHAFQLVYAPKNFTGGTNLVKPSYQGEADRKFEMDTAPGEQWINSKALEAVFTDKGLQLKMIRLDGMAYLQANLDGNWTLIGRMPLATTERTDIAFSSWDGPCDIYDLDVQWGKQAALNAFNGADFNQEGNWTEYRYFPVADTKWLVEGKVVNLDDLTVEGEHRFMTVGGISLLYKGYWCSQQFWSEVAITGDLETAANGKGLYARFMRDGDVVKSWFSADGVNWVEGQSRSGMGDGYNPILFESYNKSRVEDLKIFVGEEAEMAAKLKSIKVTKQPTKVKYAEGDKFDPAGMIITATFNDNTTAPLDPAKCVITPATLTKGLDKVTLTYAGKVATVPVTVVDRYAIKVELLNAPENVYYVTGDTLSTTGGKLKVTYHNQTQGEVAITANMCSGFDMKKAKTQDVTVTYDGMTAKFKIHVLKKAVKPTTFEDDGIFPIGSESSEVTPSQTPSAPVTAPQTLDTTFLGLYLAGVVCSVILFFFADKRKKHTK